MGKLKLRERKSFWFGAKVKRVILVWGQGKESHSGLGQGEGKEIRSEAR